MEPSTVIIRSGMQSDIRRVIAARHSEEQCFFQQRNELELCKIAQDHRLVLATGLDDEPIACAGFYETVREGRPFMELGDLWCKASHRRFGLETALVAIGLVVIEANNWKYFQHVARCKATNLAVQQFLQSLGFTPYAACEKAPDERVFKIIEAHQSVIFSAYAQAVRELRSRGRNIGTSGDYLVIEVRHQVSCYQWQDCLASIEAEEYCPESTIWPGAPILRLVSSNEST